jgi:peptidoglycan lytic transglycosylase G
MTKARLKRLVGTAVIAAGLLAGIAVLWGKQTISAPGPLRESTTIVVERGSGLRAIAGQLEAGGIIEHPRLFALSAWIDGAQHGLRAGEYAFGPGVSMKGVLDILREGRTVVRKVTLAEGLTSREMMALLEQADGLKGEIDEVPPDGSLLPDTYHYSRNDERDAIIGRMTKAMDVVLADLWETRSNDLPISTPDEAVILASIVEKETAVPSERARVAAVFVNRLRKGMRLESDPTVVYGLTGGAGALGRKLFRGDLKKDHPYNTYRIKGLPPGPICNPGRDALAAVMNPLQTDEFYFVADGTGGHVFARTLDEHNRNVSNWRKVQRAKRSKNKK